MSATVGPRPQSIQTLLLDLFPNAAVAYSLRKLRTMYTGNCIRVRRSVDNTEQDFGFVGGELDTTNLVDWVGYNLLTFSEQLQNTAYAKTRLTVSQDALTAPDITMTADILFETAEDGNHVMSRTLSVIAGQSYTYSFFAKSNGRDFIRIVTSNTLSRNPGVSAGVAWIDITNGVILFENTGFINGPDTSNLTVTDVGNGWFEISFTMPCSTTGTPNALSINLSPDTVFTTLGNATINYVGDVTKGVSIWGIQISQTSTVKPYQKTEATAGGNGFVTTWYDQSGNARNATQTTAGRQPRIVNGGIIELDNSKSSLRFDGTDDFLLTGNYNFVATDKIYISSVASSETNNSTRLVFAFSDNSTYRSFASAYFQFTGRNAAQFSTDNTNVQTNVYDTYSINQQYLLETLFNTNQALAQNRIQIYRNNNILTFNNNTNSYQGNIIGNNKPLSIGADGSGNFRHQGKIQEIIFYPTDQSTNRTGIETNINSYYNIYP